MLLKSQICPREPFKILSKDATAMPLLLCESCPPSLHNLNVERERGKTGSECWILYFYCVPQYFKHYQPHSSWVVSDHMNWELHMPEKRKNRCDPFYRIPTGCIPEHYLLMSKPHVWPTLEQKNHRGVSLSRCGVTKATEIIWMINSFGLPLKHCCIHTV